MSIIPSKKFQLASDLSKNKVLLLLKENTEKHKNLRIAYNGIKEHKIFFGNVFESYFRIFRTTHYRNGFIPEVQGKVLETKNGSVIDVTLRLNMAATVILIISTIFLLLLTVLIANFGNHSGNLGVSDLVFIMILMGIIVPVIAFNYEANQTKLALMDILKAKEVV